MDDPHSKQYGDSMYPPMFDDEPPPFDDDDNDDDGFADFGAFQTTPSVNSDNNWSSWSNASSTEVKKTNVGNDDDFGNFNQALGRLQKEENKEVVMNGLPTTIESNCVKDFTANKEDGDTHSQSKVEQHQDIKSFSGNTANSATEQSFSTHIEHNNDVNDGFGEFGSFEKIAKETEPAKIAVNSIENSNNKHAFSPVSEDTRVESGITSDDNSVLKNESKTLRGNSNSNHESAPLEELQTLSDKSDDLNSGSFASFEKSDSSDMDNEFASFSNHNSFDNFERNLKVSNGELNRKGNLCTEHSIDNEKSFKLSSESQSDPEKVIKAIKGTSTYLLESSDDSFDKKDGFQDFSYDSNSSTSKQIIESFEEDKQASPLDKEIVLKSDSTAVENRTSDLDPQEDGVNIDSKNLNSTLDDCEQEDVSFRTGEFESFSNDSTEDKNGTSLDNDDSWASLNTHKKDKNSAGFAPNFENNMAGQTDKPQGNIDTSTITTKDQSGGDEESFTSFDFQSFPEKNESLSSSKAENLQFRSNPTNQIGKDISNDDGFDDFRDFSSGEPALNISSQIMTDGKIDAQSEGDFEEFESFSRIEKTEESFKTSSAASKNVVENFASTSLTKNPSEVPPSSKESEDDRSNDDFGDFGALNTSEKSKFEVAPNTTKIKTDFNFESEEQLPVDMGNEDFGAFNTSEQSEAQFEVAPNRTENNEDLDFKNKEKLNVDKNDDDFGDFGAFGASESRSALEKPSQKTESKGQDSEKEPTSAIGEADDNFGNFGSFASPESFPANFSKANDKNTNFGSKSGDGDWAEFSMSKETPGNSKKEDIDEDFDDFAAFPSDQNTSDLKEDEWASFNSPSPAKGNKPATSNNEDFGSFGRPPVVKEKQTQPMPSKGLSSKVGLLVSTCFPQPSQQSLHTQPAQNLNLESYIDDDKNQGSLCVWSKLTSDSEVDDVWNLGYMSSTSFKWLLLTMNVTFEHIIKKWKHPSKDTQSSLSPTSSVASFDVEAASESLGILIPEPANRLNSLLRPTLLAQSQQKELNLQRVPSMSSLKKGDSGSDTTSETASLDLEFFSGSIAMQPSLQTQLTKDSSASLNSMDLLDIDLAGEPTASASDPPLVKRGPTAVKPGPQTEGRSQSLPFNLDALNKATSKSEISSEAKKFLNNLESIRFMHSTVLMFPSQFSGDQ